MCTADFRSKNSRETQMFVGGDRKMTVSAHFLVAPVTKIFYYRIINNR